MMPNDSMPWSFVYCRVVKKQGGDRTSPIYIYIYILITVFDGPVQHALLPCSAAWQLQSRAAQAWEVGGIRLETSSSLFGSTRPVTGLKLLLYAWSTEAYAFIEFCTISTVFRHLLKAASQVRLAGLRKLRRHRARLQPGQREGSLSRRLRRGGGALCTGSPRFEFPAMVHLLMCRVDFSVHRRVTVCRVSRILGQHVLAKSCSEFLFRNSYLDIWWLRHESSRVTSRVCCEAAGQAWLTAATGKCTRGVTLGRGDDTVGNPHQAQIVKFELFELILL